MELARENSPKKAETITRGGQLEQDAQKAQRSAYTAPGNTGLLEQAVVLT